MQCPVLPTVEIRILTRLPLVAPRPRVSPGYNHVICQSTDYTHPDKAGCCDTVEYASDRQSFIARGCGVPLPVDNVFDW